MLSSIANVNLRGVSIHRGGGGTGARRYRSHVAQSVLDGNGMGGARARNEQAVGACVCGLYFFLLLLRVPSSVAKMEAILRLFHNVTSQIIAESNVGEGPNHIPPYLRLPFLTGVNSTPTSPMSFSTLSRMACFRPSGNLRTSCL